ncbi:unnamed protein product [Symbiodinium microadriaticum]|nr:unnamed protein product [Symbiodinium microadriaticum]CAE7913465.1 unnamed protein product [Symbiodinium sp. KB8]
MEALMSPTGEANAWDVPTMWQQTTCEVLASGVSCADKLRYGSTCGGYVVGAMPSSQPPVFLTEQIAVCPGTYWCAKQGDTCRCNGEITYASELFNGFAYTVPATAKAYKVASNSSWKCGTDQSGKPFPADPALGWRLKHCWCTPQGILDIVRKHNASSLHKKKCSELANFDFQHPGPQRLLRKPQAAQAEEAPARRLATGSDNRRRTFSYTPWALVSVPKHSFDGDQDRGGHKQLSCAYEFGVPAASSAMYESDGPYKSADVWRAEDVAKKWGSLSTRPCWVRVRSEAGERLADCALALDKPGTLTDEATAKTQHAYRWLWISLGLAVFCTGGCIFLSVQHVLNVHFYQERSTDSRQARSDQEHLVSQSL